MKQPLPSIQPQREILLYFGSFNPLHQAHLQLVRYAQAQLPCDELWLVLSPLNPLKEASSQLPFAFRKALITEAIKAEEQLRLCSLETLLPYPHYTLRTLQALELLHPDCRFSLLIGGDNLASIQRWHQWQRLLERYPLYVYPRPSYDEVQLPEGLETAGITLCHDAPQLSLSSTELREAARSGEDRHRDLAVPEYWERFVEQLQQLERQTTKSK